MFPQGDVTFSLTYRKNVHAKNGHEWALSCRVVDNYSWTIKTWDKKPSEEVIKDTQYVVIRSMAVYHRSLQIPSFELRVSECKVWEQ